MVYKFNIVRESLLIIYIYIIPIFNIYLDIFQDI